MNVVSNTSEFTADVLRVVNKIMEGSVRCQEELTMMGGYTSSNLFPSLPLYSLPLYCLSTLYLCYLVSSPCLN